jgi:NAD(P)-dependent dehydrogenase (short-subunit alcohol dehydrogenase family)
VLVGGRDAERRERVALGIEERGGLAWPLELDLSLPEATRAGVERARELARPIGPIAWLVNNAGIAESAPLFAAGEEELLRRHLEVNFHGARRTMALLVPAMLEAGYGRVVNVASSAGLRGYAYVAAYCASKHALAGYSRAAALELEGRGVTVNLLCPHYVDSPMTESSVRRIVEKTGRRPEDVRAWLAAQNPGGRLVQPLEVAASVLGLLDGDQNGLVLELDGSAPGGEGG